MYAKSMDGKRKTKEQTNPWRQINGRDEKYLNRHKPKIGLASE